MKTYNYYSSVLLYIHRTYGDTYYSPRSSALSELYSLLTGNSSATYNDVKELAYSNPNANTFRGFNSGKDVCCWVLNVLWDAMYLSFDVNDNVILTLWCDNYSQFEDKEERFGVGDFQVGGDEYSGWLRQDYEGHDIIEGIVGYECNYDYLYMDMNFGFVDGRVFSPAPSYIRTIPGCVDDYNFDMISDNYSNPGNLYAVWGTSDFSNKIDWLAYNDEDSHEGVSDGTWADEYIWTPFENSTGGDYASQTIQFEGWDKYLVTPRQMSWQENQSAKEILGMPYNLSNESWSTSVSNDGFYSANNNYANVSGSDAWADEYVWLPSLSEIGYSGVDGLWGASTEQRECPGNNSYNDSYEGNPIGLYEIENTASTWTRSANYKQSYGYYFIKSSGDGKGVGVSYARAYRPCIHLNLTAMEADKL